MTPQLATATLTATLALALALATAPGAEAAAVQSYSYSTSGSIAGMSGDQPIEFWGVPDGNTLTTPGSFAVGQFITSPLPATATLTYNQTPFTIDLIVRAATTMNSSSPSFDTDYKISGVLDGSITGAGVSSMVATISSILVTTGGTGNTPPFSASDLRIAPQAIIAPNGQNDGFSTLSTQVVSGTGVPAPAPEPTSIAVFGVALASWICHRRSRSKAKAR